MQTSTASAISVVLAPLVTSRHTSENLYPPHVHHILKLALSVSYLCTSVRTTYSAPQSKL